MLDVSTSGFYDWLNRPQSNRSRENQALTEKIKRLHHESRGIYGSPKIHEDLVAEGETCSVNRVARLMKAGDVKSKMARKFVVTTDSKNTRQPAPDLLQRRFKVNEQDKAWVSDTTFIATRDGWLYLAVVLDLFYRQVIGWAMSRKGECLDNAVAESFFGTLKNELVYHEDYKTRAEARQSIFEYIEVFYNRQRRHAFLNYMTPVEYEKKYACN